MHGEHPERDVGAERPPAGLRGWCVSRPPRRPLDRDAHVGVPPLPPRAVGTARPSAPRDDGRGAAVSLLHGSALSPLRSPIGDMAGRPPCRLDQSRRAHHRVHGRGGRPDGPDRGVTGVTGAAQPASPGAGGPGRVTASPGSRRNDTTSRPIAMHSARRSARSDGVANSPYTIVCVGTDIASRGHNALRSRSDSLPPTRTSYRVWATALASSGTRTLLPTGTLRRRRHPGITRTA